MHTVRYFPWFVTRCPILPGFEGGGHASTSLCVLETVSCGRDGDTGTTNNPDMLINLCTSTVIISCWVERPAFPMDHALLTRQAPGESQVTHCPILAAADVRYENVRGALGGGSKMCSL